LIRLLLHRIAPPLRAQAIRCLRLLLPLTILPVIAQTDSPYRSLPRTHATNKAAVLRSHQELLRKHSHSNDLLFLPGIVANRSTRRIELSVERSSVAPDAPCEFLVVSESSDHTYESLFIAFAEPADVHRALEFIGLPPGQPPHPAHQRSWAKGEKLHLHLHSSNQPPLHVEHLLFDRRSNAHLPETGFLFTGSPSSIPSTQPHRTPNTQNSASSKAIVSLFSTSDAVLQVPQAISKTDVYPNTTSHPDHPLEPGSLFTLVAEPASPAGSSWVEDMTLEVDSIGKDSAPSEPDLEPLARLRFQLRSRHATLNSNANLVTVIASIAAGDRSQHDYPLALRWSPNVRLVDAQALAEILASIDRDQGVRIEPPAAGDLYYRAFTPNRDLLHRNDRPFHPLELSLKESHGQISGHLTFVDSVWKEGASRPELQFKEHSIRDPDELRRTLEQDQQQRRRSGQRPRAPVLLTFAPAGLTVSQVSAFLQPVLTNYFAIHLFLDESPPPQSPTLTPP